MRIIKFRGNATHDGKHVYGSLIKKRFTGFAEWMIEDENGLGSDVETKSISQFTGEYDKDGKEIYENDIINLGGKLNYKVLFENGCFFLYRYEVVKGFDKTPKRFGPLFRIKQSSIPASIVRI